MQQPPPQAVYNPWQEQWPVFPLAAENDSEIPMTPLHQQKQQRSFISNRKGKRILAAVLAAAILAGGLGTGLWLWNRGLSVSEEAAQAERAYRQDKKEFDAVVPNVIKIEEKYKKSGYIPQDKADEYLDEVLEYTEQKKQEGLLKDCGKGWVRLPSGLGVLVDPPIRDVLRSGNDIEIATIDPYGSAGKIETAAENLKNAFGFAYTKKLKNKAVTLEELKKLGDYDIVIWQGHGGYNNEVRSLLGTQIKWKSIVKNDYLSDIADDRIWVSDKGFVCITSKWFDKYLQAKDKGGGIIFLGACFTVAEDTLAYSLASNGAFSAVYGFDFSVNIRYMKKVRDTLFSLLASKSPATGDYYTLAEALEKTLELEGENDKDYKRPFNDTPAALKLRFFKEGNQHLRLSDLVEQKPQTPSDNREETTVPLGEHLNGPERLIANDNDFQILKNMMESIDYLPWETFDSAKSKAEDVIGLVTGIGIPGYNYYFKDEGLESLNESDPLGKFNRSYSRLPSSKVDWILTDIFHVEGDHSLSTDGIYYHQGFYYFATQEGGFAPDIRADLLDAQRLDDGKYKVSFEIYDENLQEAMYILTSYLTVDLVLIDGQRQWTIYEMSNTGNALDESVQYQVSTAGDALNMRCGPGQSFKAVGKIQNGAIIHIEDIQNGWGYGYSDEGFGWVSMGFLKEYTHDWNYLPKADDYSLAQ